MVTCSWNYLVGAGVRGGNETTCDCQMGPWVVWECVSGWCKLRLQQLQGEEGDLSTVIFAAYATFLEILSANSGLDLAINVHVEDRGLQMHHWTRRRTGKRACLYQCTCFPALQIGLQQWHYDLYMLMEAHCLICLALLIQPSRPASLANHYQLSMANRTLSADENADEDGEAFTERSLRGLMRRGWLSTLLSTWLF